MKKIIPYLLTFLLIFGVNISAKGQDDKVLTNEDVVKMVNIGLSIDIIKAKISSSKSQFDTSLSALEILKKSGVPDSIILIMVQSDTTKSNNSGNFDKSKEKTTIPLFLRDIVKTNINDLDSFPEKYDNKVVFFQAEIKDYRREEAGVFSIGLSSGIFGSSLDDYKYIPPVLGRSGISIIGDEQIIQVINGLKKDTIPRCIYCFMGGVVQKLNPSSSRSYGVLLFNVDWYSTSPTTSLLGAMEFNTFSRYIDYFVKNGADINVKSKEDITPLIKATKAKNIEPIKALIKLKANLNETDSQGKTALIYAVENNFDKGVEQLIKAGADLKIKDRNGMSAYDYALKINNREIIKIFNKFLREK